MIKSEQRGLYQYQFVGFDIGLQVFVCFLAMQAVYHLNYPASPTFEIESPKLFAQKAEIRRIVVQGQLRQICLKILS
jgi:hypothetical protein